ncbi:thiamine/thiamine pyrophosphate ABC transporter permease ThiP [Ahrensia kielensis]|uniref:thiamine/thiamine pyrophosphate ABC transporter permease ThiP n=1 Tax=Ahrensia kielensis TaxID=76980 RepID=UPI00036A25F4|nr:thiamine/thiamine pyrophosphate ABC transporter permease ThiP [Ahrensia kielensis]
MKHTKPYQGLGLALPPLALFLLAGLALGAIIALVVFAVLGGSQVDVIDIATDTVVWRIIRFTLWQAALSTLLSALFAIPVGFLLFEYKHFYGRELLLRLFAIPLVLPQIVAVLAIVSLYGNQGFVTQALKQAGLPIGTIYGLSGILIAHVYFNMPLVARVILGALNAMPAEYERLSHQLNMGPLQRLRHICWPYMRPALFNASALVFMLCVTSFTVVLTLGGGPRATTLEVGIYQALTFDFDIPRAVVLTVMQLALTAFAVYMFARAGGNIDAGMTLERTRPLLIKHKASQIILAVVVLGVAALFVASPFVAIFAKGIAADLIKLFGQSAVQKAIMTSFVLGALAACLCIAVTLALCEGAVRAGFMQGAYSHAASLVLVVPPIVIAAGWFILLRPFVSIYEAAPYLVVSVNAAMALPFAMRFVLPARQTAAQRHDRLCAQLGIQGFDKWRLVLLPVMIKPLSVGFAFAFALSLGDLGVIALFGSEKVQTLPYLILQRMGSYRTNDAAGLALILCVFTLAILMFADRSSVSLKDKK